MKSLKIFFLALPFLFFSCKTEGQMTTAIQQTITPQPSAGWTISGLKITKSEPLYGAGYIGKTITFTAKATVHPELPKGSGRFYFHSFMIVTEDGKNKLDGEFDESAVVCAAGTTFTLDGGGNISDDLTHISVRVRQVTPLAVIKPMGEDIRTMIMGRWYGDWRQQFYVSESNTQTINAAGEATAFFKWAFDGRKFTFVSKELTLAGSLSENGSVLTLVRVSDAATWKYTRNAMDFVDTTTQEIRYKLTKKTWYVADSVSATKNGYSLTLYENETFHFRQNGQSRLDANIWKIDADTLYFYNAKTLKKMGTAVYGDGKLTIDGKEYRQAPVLYIDKVKERLKENGNFENEGGEAFYLYPDGSAASNFETLLKGNSRWWLGTITTNKISLTIIHGTTGERYSAYVGLEGPIVFADKGGINYRIKGGLTFNESKGRD